MNARYLAVIIGVIISIIIASIVGLGFYACTKDGKGGWIPCKGNEQNPQPKVTTVIRGSGSTVSENATSVQGGANPNQCPGNPTNASLRISIGQGAQGNVVSAKMNCGGAGELSDSPTDPGDGSTIIGGGGGQLTGQTPSCKVDLSQVGNSNWRVECTFG